MIVLNKDDFILSFWAATVPDFFACVWRSPGDPKDTWKLMFRRRRHVDEKVFDSHDEKRWYQGTMHGTAEDVRARLKAGAAWAGMRGFREIPINGFFSDAAMEKLTADPAAHVRMQEKEPHVR